VNIPIRCTSTACSSVNQGFEQGGMITATQWQIRNIVQYRSGADALITFNDLQMETKYNPAGVFTPYQVLNEVAVNYSKMDDGVDTCEDPENAGIYLTGYQITMAFDFTSAVFSAHEYGTSTTIMGAFQVVYNLNGGRRLMRTEFELDRDTAWAARRRAQETNEGAATDPSENKSNYTAVVTTSSGEVVTPTTASPLTDDDDDATPAPADDDTKSSAVLVAFLIIFIIVAAVFGYFCYVRTQHKDQYKAENKKLKREHTTMTMQLEKVGGSNKRTPDTTQ